MKAKTNFEMLMSSQSDAVQKMVANMQEERECRGDDAVWNGKTYGEIYDFITKKYQEKKLCIASVRGVIPRQDIYITQGYVNISVATGIGDMFYEAILKTFGGVIQYSYERLTQSGCDLCENFDGQVKSFEREKVFMEIVHDLSEYLNEGLAKKYRFDKDEKTCEE